MTAGTTGHVQTWNPGAKVFYWRRARTTGNLRCRRSRLSRRWRGPAVVRGQVRREESPDPAYCVAHGGYLLLVAAPHLRSATAEERLADRLMTRQLADVQGLLGQDRSVLIYLNLTRAEQPMRRRPFEHRGACSHSTLKTHRVSKWGT